MPLTAICFKRVKVKFIRFFVNIFCFFSFIRLRLQTQLCRFLYELANFFSLRLEGLMGPGNSVDGGSILSPGHNYSASGIIPHLHFIHYTAGGHQPSPLLLS